MSERSVQLWPYPDYDPILVAGFAHKLAKVHRDELREQGFRRIIADNKTETGSLASVARSVDAHIKRRMSAFLVMASSDNYAVGVASLAPDIQVLRPNSRLAAWLPLPFVKILFDLSPTNGTGPGTLNPTYFIPEQKPSSDYYGQPLGRDTVGRLIDEAKTLRSGASLWAIVPPDSHKEDTYTRNGFEVVARDRFDEREGIRGRLPCMDLVVLEMPQAARA